jgi:hypothetical protein
MTKKELYKLIESEVLDSWGATIVFNGYEIGSTSNYYDSNGVSNKNYFVKKEWSEKAKGFDTLLGAINYIEKQ